MRINNLAVAPLPKHTKNLSTNYSNEELFISDSPRISRLRVETHFGAQTRIAIRAARGLLSFAKRIIPESHHRVLVGVLLLLATTASAQTITGTTFAAGGPLGIYVAAGIQLPSSVHPIDGGVAYLFERRTPGQQTWQEIATVGAPASLEEFRARLEQSMHEIPDTFSLSNVPVDSLWRRIAAYGNADSLGVWSGVLLIRLATGMMYLDTTAQRGMNYQYRVSLIGANHQPIRTYISNSESFPERVELPRLQLYDKSSNERRIVIEWTSGTGKGASMFRTYRQEGLRGEYHPITAGRYIMARRDSIFYLIADSLIQAMQGYRYYLLPTDYYGNPGVPSDTVLVGAYNFQNVPLPDSFHVASVDTPAGIRIGWRLAKPQLVRNLSIYRSVDYDTGYHRLSYIATGDTEYTDQTTRPMQRYFYYLVMSGPLGETSPPSAKVFGIYISHVTPVAPGIVGFVGTTRGVRLSIITTDVQQTDYEVFRNDGVRPELHLVSGLVPRKDSITVFEDTSSALSGELTYAYAVRAENASHVFSSFSDTVHVRPNLPTHPPTPLGLTATVEGKAVQLYWNDMRPGNHTVSGYFVYRKEIVSGKRKSEFLKLNDTLLTASRNRFTDTTAEAGKKYEYAVRDRDFFGGESNMSTTSTAEIPEIMPLPPGGLRARSTSTGIFLQWDRTIQPNLSEYRVYRYQRRQKPVRIETVKSSGNLETLDRRTRKGDLYFYYVTTVNTKGVESGRSMEVGIRR